MAEHRVVELQEDDWLDHLHEAGGQIYLEVRPLLYKQAARQIEETNRLMMMHSGAVWNSAGGGQRPQQLAEIFAREACVVHLSYANHNVLGQPDDAPIVANLENWGAWQQCGATEGSIFYTSFPDTWLEMALPQIPDDWFVWYDCVDDWRHMPANDWYRVGTEARLISRADLVTCTGHRLAEHITQIAGRRPPPMEVAYNSTRLVGQPINTYVRPFDCVFVGWMADNWLDWNLLRKVAEKHSLLMVGPVPEDGVPFDHDNITWTGQVSNSELLPVLSRAHVGLAPFRDIDLSRAVFPIKYCDYLAAGCPTVATHLPELVGKPYAFVAWDHRGFLSAIDELLGEPLPPSLIAAEAELHTAEARVEQIKPLLGGRF